MWVTTQQAVQTNRARLQAALGQIHTRRPPCVFKPGAWHGVAALDCLSPDNIEADACVATEAGVVCTIMVADCLPVLLAHPAAPWWVLLMRAGGAWQARAGWVCWNQPCVRCLSDFRL